MTRIGGLYKRHKRRVCRDGEGERRAAALDQGVAGPAGLHKLCACHEHEIAAAAFPPGPSASAAVLCKRGVAAVPMAQRVSASRLGIKEGAC